MGTAPAAFPVPTSGFSVGKVIGAVLVAAVAGGGAIAWSMFKGKFVAGKNKATYSALSLDDKRPDGDKMITSVAGLATKWKKDSHWWSCNYQAVHADGTVDVSKGAEVMYVSPSGVAKKSKKLRQDSIRKFKFGMATVDYTQQWDALNEWKNVEEPKSPNCSIKDLAKALGKEGLKGDKTVRITFDPKWDWTSEQMWHVIGEDPKIDARYSMKNCEKIEKAGTSNKGEGDEASE
jgi:hypothetical protein